MDTNKDMEKCKRTENDVTQNTVHGFKVFNPDWTCRGFQYEVGNTYKMDDAPVCCKKGFHFCTKAVDCFKYYNFNPENKVAEVIALGEVDNNDDNKYCTNMIRIMREIPWDEVQRIVNVGKECTGLGNTGNWNTGNWNTGNWNTGDYNTGNCNTGNRNTGDYNTGNCNTGNRNTGNWNTGDRNTGNCNTGNWNTGDRNTGDWNRSSFNNGCFMTEEPNISMFNKPSDWSYMDWVRSDARHLLDQMPKSVVEWVSSEDMTDEEKAEYPTHETTGGYLKILNESESGQLWWDGLPEEQKDIIKALPNFDEEIFLQCTGIRCNG